MNSTSTTKKILPLKYINSVKYLMCIHEYVMIKWQLYRGCMTINNVTNLMIITRINCKIDQALCYIQSCVSAGPCTCVRACVRALVSGCVRACVGESSDKNILWSSCQLPEEGSQLEVIHMLCHANLTNFKPLPSPVTLFFFIYSRSIL